MQNFKIGDYVMVFRNKGVIVDVTSDSKMYNVARIKKSIVFVNENDLRKIDPTPLEKIKLSWIKAKYMTNQKTNILAIQLYFFKLTGFFYNFNEYTEFCIVRLNASDESEISINIDKNDMLYVNYNNSVENIFCKNGMLKVKHVIQIRKECPQYWKNFSNLMNRFRKTYGGNHMYLQPSYFFKYINNPKYQKNTDDNTDYNYFIIICGRTINKTFTA